MHLTCMEMAPVVGNAAFSTCIVQWYQRPSASVREGLELEVEEAYFGAA